MIQWRQALFQRTLRSFRKTYLMDVNYLHVWSSSFVSGLLLLWDATKLDCLLGRRNVPGWPFRLYISKSRSSCLDSGDLTFCLHFMPDKTLIECITFSTYLCWILDGESTSHLRSLLTFDVSHSSSWLLSQIALYGSARNPDPMLLLNVCNPSGTVKLKVFQLCI